MSHWDQWDLPERSNAEGIELVLHKATEGTTVPDERYLRVARQAASKGYHWGAYHFATYEGYVNDPRKKTIFKADPTEQARHFVQCVLNARPQGQEKVLLVLDLEYSSPKTQQFMSLQAARNAIEEIHRLTGHYPGIYTGASFGKEHMTERVLARLYDPQNSTKIKQTLARCWLWLAQYDNHPEPPVVPPDSPWGKTPWLMWQYTTNPRELKDMKIKPHPSRRHLLGKNGGELNYIALDRSQISQWFEDNAWDYSLRAPMHSDANSLGEPFLPSQH